MSGLRAAVATGTIELMVVDHDPARVRTLVGCGINTFLVDWECLGKEVRQQGFDTEISPGSDRDLAIVSGIPHTIAWCRVNRLGPHTPQEVERAIAAGAHGVFLPMVSGPADVDHFLRIVNDRVAAGILVETVDALACVRQLASFPLDRVYFGLNDFAISRGGGSIFLAVRDGSVARAREAFAGTRFGFGGITAMDGGHPVPCRCLIQEMARIGCDFGFLRRSFRRDLAARDPRAVVAGIHAAWRECLERDAATVARDHARLNALLDDVA